ncbi:ribose transport system substrate-binding protein [Bryocella elongata]|uniref:Ribose transport system substrate-binding protein n=1 Tax=Bryocella elongata TaxID=863522 RepID=A0A1H5UC84_9BACT|nr:substrate-binding domain-containing protein [Bryocella elongata]SEF72028.1 ribose transport system substrate-binding protein [Bryocella elongata]
MAPKSKSKRLYLIPVLTKALDILELLQNENQPMVLEAIHKRTKISKTTVYRILKTLVHRGYVSQTGDRQYRHVARPRKLRFGFGGQSAEMPFSQAVTASLREAAAAVGIDLIVLDNKYDADTAIANAERFISERVDLVIDFQVEQRAAPIIADKIAEAKIPLIAVDIPHPHATYFGVDNYRAGLETGRVLAEFAINHWTSTVDWMLGLDLNEAGPLVQSRITGAMEGVKALLPEVPIESFVRVDGRGLRETSYKIVLEFLKRHPKDKHILIAAANDTSALGAIAAARELGREKSVAIVGSDCVDEMLREIEQPGSPALASISHEVHLYGPRLIELGLAILRGETVPPYNYVQHRAITADVLRRSPEVSGLFTGFPADAEEPAAARPSRKRSAARNEASTTSKSASGPGPLADDRMSL